MFRTKIRKLGTPLNSPVLSYKSGVRGAYITRTCFRRIKHEAYLLVIILMLMNCHRNRHDIHDVPEFLPTGTLEHKIQINSNYTYSNLILPCIFLLYCADNPLVVLCISSYYICYLASVCCLFFPWPTRKAPQATPGPTQKEDTTSFYRQTCSFPENWHQNML